MDINSKCPSEYIPFACNILSDKDKVLYQQLKAKFSQEDRFSRTNNPFESIQEFCEYEEQEKSKRYNACGICWKDDLVAINIRYLSILLSKPKLSVLRLCMRLKYTQQYNQDFSFLFEKIPFLSDVRQWTIWKKEEKKRDKNEEIQERKEIILKIKENAINLFNTFYDLLSEEDKELYQQLKEKVSQGYLKEDIFNDIKIYCEHEKNESWKRCLVCGVCWNGPYVAINNHFLSFLASKDKGTFSRFLRRINYDVVLKNDIDTSFLLEKIPILNDARFYHSLKSWIFHKINQNERTDDITFVDNLKKMEFNDMKVLTRNLNDAHLFQIQQPDIYTDDDLDSPPILGGTPFFSVHFY